MSFSAENSTASPKHNSQDDKSFSELVEFQNCQDAAQDRNILIMSCTGSEDGGKDVKDLASLLSSSRAKSNRKSAKVINERTAIRQLSFAESAFEQIEPRTRSCEKLNEKDSESRAKLPILSQKTISRGLIVLQKHTVMAKDDREPVKQMTQIRFSKTRRHQPVAP